MASPPARSYEQRARRERPEPYQGPPSYPATPRWGFPHLVWRWPTSVPGTASGALSPMDRARVLAASVTTALWLYATIAVLAASAEVWRYILLLDSRSGALPPGLVMASDALVTSTALLCIAVGLLALTLCLMWLFVARAAASALSEVDPPRLPWQVVAGILVPVLNFVQAGAIVAELEHMVCRRPTGQRPSPSRLVRWWWTCWVASGLLAIVTLLWRMRDGVQAMADGVLLSAATDLVAAGLAVLTVRVVQRLTALLVPVSSEQARKLRVVSLRGAPAPQLRPHRPAGSPR